MQNFLEQGTVIYWARDVYIEKYQDTEPIVAMSLCFAQLCSACVLKSPLSLAAGSGCERLSLQGLGSFRRFVPRFAVGVDCGNASHAQFKLTANVPGPGLSSLIGRGPNYLSDWLLKDVKRQVRFILNMSEPSRASCVARPGRSELGLNFSRCNAS